MPFTDSHRVELGAIDILPDGESFVLSLVGENEQVHRMELPCWTVHQLMRTLPRLDAALLRARDEIDADLIAYPVVGWNLERSGADRTVALSVQSDRQVESAFLFGPDDARALHAALGETLAAEAERDRRPVSPQPCPTNAAVA